MDKKKQLACARLAGSFWLVVVLIAAPLTIHFVVVLHEQFTHSDNQETYRVHANRFLGPNPVCGDIQQERNNRLIHECDGSRTMLATSAYGYIPWGYWKFVLGKTAEEHKAHVNSWMQSITWAILGALVTFAMTSPTAFFGTALSWLASTLVFSPGCAYCFWRCSKRIRRQLDEQVMMGMAPKPRDAEADAPVPSLNQVAPSRVGTGWPLPARSTGKVTELSIPDAFYLHLLGANTANTPVPRQHNF